MTGVAHSERSWLLAILLAAAIARLLFPESLAVEHFDEGVYASNLWFGESDHYEYPGRPFYAPPLWPTVLEFFAMAGLGAGLNLRGIVPILPGILAGIVTVVSAWWIVRSHAGATCGLVAAALIGAADFHIAYSRTALTDVPVTLFFLWTWHFIPLAITSGRTVHLLAAGVFTGLAWWTKYNGWLPVAVGLFAGIAHALLQRYTMRDWLTGLQRGSVIGLIALAVWSPVLWGLQPLGGYAAVSANHRQYLHSFDGWAEAFTIQAAHLRAYEGTGSVVGLILVAAMLVCRGPQQPGRWNPLALAVVYFGFKLFAYSLALELGFAIFGIVRTSTNRALSSQTRCFALYLGCWIITLLVLTPFYHPYPRLMMPLFAATMVAMSLGIVPLVEKLQTQLFQQLLLRLVVVGLIAIAGILLVPAKPVFSRLAWQRRDGYRSIADRWDGVLHRAGQQQIIYVWGEPAFLFHLRARGFNLVGPVQSLEFAKSPAKAPTFLIAGPHAKKDRRFEEAMKLHTNRFEPLDAANIHPSDIVSRDEHSNVDAIRNELHHLILYRVR